jgi:hypothetical protein
MEDEDATGCFSLSEDKFHDEISITRKIAPLTGPGIVLASGGV